MNIAALFFLISIFVVPGIWLLLTRAKRLQARVDHEFLARISSPGGKSVNHPVKGNGRYEHLDIFEGVNHYLVTSPYGRD